MYAYQPSAHHQHKYKSGETDKPHKNINMLSIESYQSFESPVNSGHI